MGTSHTPSPSLCEASGQIVTCLKHGGRECREAWHWVALSPSVSHHLHLAQAQNAARTCVCRRVCGYIQLLQFRRRLVVVTAQGCDRVCEREFVCVCVCVCVCTFGCIRVCSMHISIMSIRMYIRTYTHPAEQ